MVSRSTSAEPEDSASRARRRRRVSNPPRLADGVGGILLAITIAGSALLIGAQHTQVLLPIALAAAASAALLRPTETPRLTWVLLGLGAYTLLQLVPLPIGWVEALSPSAADVWRGSQRPFGQPPPNFASLSVDPGAGALEVVKWFGYACVVLAASGWRARHGSTALALLVFCSALAVSVVTLAHGIVEAPRIFGIFMPNGNFRWTRGPLVNANSLSGYLNLGLFAGIGVWLSGRAGSWVRLMPLGFAILAVHVVLTGSRAGVAMLGLGAILVGFVVVRQRRPDWLRVGGAVGLTLLATLAFGIFVGGTETQQELLDTKLGVKFTVWGWALELVRDFPVFGAGRGAFETAFQPYRKPFGNEWTTIFAHAENFPLEWICDWGIPVGLAGLVGFAFAGRGISSRALRDPWVASLATALAVLLLHNLVDLALEVFCVMAAGLVVFVAMKPSPGDSRGGRLRLGAAVLGVVAGAVVVVVTGAAPVKVERERLAREYTAFARSRSRDGTALVRTLESSIRRHPGDAYFPMIGALIARRTGRGDPLVWLGRALERAPMNGNTHLVLAQVLAARGARKQALIHVRLTALYDYTLSDYAFGQAASWAKSSEELIGTFPRGMPGSELLKDLCDEARGELAVGCWREVMDRGPTPEASHRLAGALLDALEGGRPPCAGDDAPRCVQEVEGALAALTRMRVPADWQMALHRARLRANRGDPEGAVEVALEGCPASPEAADCVERALGFARRARRSALLAAVVERYLALRCGEPHHCAAAHEEVGAAYAELESWGLALRHFSAATTAEPTTERWIRSAEVAARAGSSVAARLALERASRAGELSAAHRERAAAVDALLRQSPGIH